MMSKSRQYIRQNKSKLRRRRVFTWILLPILLLGFGLTSYGIFLYNKAESVMGDSYKPLDRDTSRVAAADTKVENTSILIIGVDDSATRGFSNSSRSDALMVATLMLLLTLLMHLVALRLKFLIHSRNKIQKMRQTRLL